MDMEYTSFHGNDAAFSKTSWHNRTAAMKCYAAIMTDMKERELELQSEAGIQSQILPHELNIGWK